MAESAVPPGRQVRRIPSAPLGSYKPAYGQVLSRSPSWKEKRKGLRQEHNSPATSGIRPPRGPGTLGETDEKGIGLSQCRRTEWDAGKTNSAVRSR
jgi:hypothetical protein